MSTAAALKSVPGNNVHHLVVKDISTTKKPTLEKRKAQRIGTACSGSIYVPWMKEGQRTHFIDIVDVTPRGVQFRPPEDLRDLKMSFPKLQVDRSVYISFMLPNLEMTFAELILRYQAKVIIDGKAVIKNGGVLLPDHGDIARIGDWYRWNIEQNLSKGRRLREEQL
jgi:hypothetical protein